MSTLIDKYENYLKQKEQYEKELYLYESKKSESLDKVRQYLDSLNIRALADLGFSFDTSKYNLEDDESIKAMYRDLLELCSALERMGEDLMREV